MTISRYRLTALGWLGAALFVLPTPIAMFEYARVLRRFASRGEYGRALDQVRGVIAVPEFSPWFFTALATAMLVGVVLLLIGREIVTTD